MALLELFHFDQLPKVIPIRNCQVEPFLSLTESNVSNLQRRGCCLTTLRRQSQTRLCILGLSLKKRQLLPTLLQIDNQAFAPLPFTPGAVPQGLRGAVNRVKTLNLRAQPPNCDHTLLEFAFVFLGICQYPREPVCLLNQPLHLGNIAFDILKLFFQPGNPPPLLIHPLLQRNPCAPLLAGCSPVLPVLLSDAGPQRLFTLVSKFAPRRAVQCPSHGRQTEIGQNQLRPLVDPQSPPELIIQRLFKDCLQPVVGQPPSKALLTRSLNFKCGTRPPEPPFTVHQFVITRRQRDLNLRTLIASNGLHSLYLCLLRSVR